MGKLSQARGGGVEMDNIYPAPVSSLNFPIDMIINNKSFFGITVMLREFGVVVVSQTEYKEESTWLVATHTADCSLQILRYPVYILAIHYFLQE